MEIATYTGGIVQTNAYLLQCQSGRLLVDAPEDVASWINEIGATVDAVFLTHQHYDHIQGLAEVIDQHQCSIYSHSQYDEELTLAKELEEATGMSVPVASFKVDNLLAEKASISIAGEAWQLLYLPGHSQDSLGLYHQEEEILFGGDVLFAGGIGRTDFLGSNHQDLMDSLVKLPSLISKQTTVYSGHGPTTTLEKELLSNPFLSNS